MAGSEQSEELVGRSCRWTARHHSRGAWRPTIIFCAHLDIVGTAGMTIPPFDPRLEGNRIYGRGSYDMKGSVAAAMAADTVH
jgi:acetylornithine deacetylase/succinyl-diaminopimelate desuccinylase-like protein